MAQDVKPVSSRTDSPLCWGDIEDEGLELAKDAADGAHAPYSEFSVGAAIHTTEGYYTGANVEVGGRSLSTHAEMLAIQKAVTDGALEKDPDEDVFVLVCVWTESDENDIPCSMCQHVLAELVDSAMLVSGTPEDKSRVTLEDELGDAWLPGENR